MSFQNGASTAADCQESSIQIFRRFITIDTLSSGTVLLDASRVVSKDCYQKWLNTRLSTTNGPERTFQRSLTAHLTGSDGRQAFLPEEEAGILKVVRVKSVWFAFKNVYIEANIIQNPTNRPAFRGTRFAIGCKGFRAIGFNEKAFETRWPRLPSSYNQLLLEEHPCRLRKRARIESKSGHFETSGVQSMKMAQAAANAKSPITWDIDDEICKGQEEIEGLETLPSFGAFVSSYGISTMPCDALDQEWFEHFGEH